jgi:hypothetical protein
MTHIPILDLYYQSPMILFSGMSIVCIVCSFWKTERIHDAMEVSSAVSSSTTTTLHNTAEILPKKEEETTIITGNLDNVTNVLYSPVGRWLGLGMIGWMGWALAFGIRWLHGQQQQHRDVVMVVLVLLNILILTISQCVLWPAAWQGRSILPHATFFVCTELGGSIGMACSIMALIQPSYNNDDRDCWFPILVSSICIPLAKFVTLRYRHHHRRPTRQTPQSFHETTATLFHGGAPLFVTGWFGMWIGFNVENALFIPPNGAYIPVPSASSSRTIVCGMGTVLILAVYYTTNYAHDHHHPSSSTTPINNVTTTSTDDAAFGIDYYGYYDEDDDNEQQHPKNPRNDDTTGHSRVRRHFCGTLGEMQFAYGLAWTVFAMSVCIHPETCYPRSYGDGVMLWIDLLAVTCFVGIGNRSGTRHASLRNRDSAHYTLWTRCLWVAYIIAAMAVGWSSGSIAAAILVASGCACLEVGEWTILRDRKRGSAWLNSVTPTTTDHAAAFTSSSTMSTTAVESPVQVFSWGTIVHSFGMLLVAWGVSIPC